MAEFVKVFESTGAVLVAVDEDFVSIQQEGLIGDDGGEVSIPRPLFREVLYTICLSLDADELKDVGEMANALMASVSLRSRD